MYIYDGSAALNARTSGALLCTVGRGSVGQQHRVWHVYEMQMKCVATAQRQLVGFLPRSRPLFCSALLYCIESHSTALWFPFFA